VHPELPYDAYTKQLGACDLFLSPFPYGNTNGIIDTVSLALPGVCLDGIEVHAHIDAAMFDRIGLPPDLVADSIDRYVAAACRLITTRTGVTVARTSARPAISTQPFLAATPISSEN
jgi:predicted O-linked N-acetylglucosamine transferase (SPINDLY family)